jgi:amidase
MPVRQPTIDELARIAEAYGLSPTREDLESFSGLIAPLLESYARLDQLPEPALPVKYPRSPGYRPWPEDNPLGAWYWRSEIRGAQNGPLAGKTIAIKDNVCVAGIPMMNGTSVLEGYVPDADATIVTRILDAGGTILGKAVCESLCLSGGSHTSDTGPVLNPHDPTRTTGGSSSGSAALVASKEVDMAIGGDQGGSIRIPGSWCGIFGLKPTYGLVPYTGVFPIELTLDHTGPMARTAADCALLLEAIAGPDGLDPRQSEGLQSQAYTEALTGDIKGLRLGIVEEGFGIEGISEKDVDEAVTEAAHGYEKLGARVKKILIPWHRDGLHIWNGIAIEGVTMLMVAGNGMGTNWKGHYSTSLLDVYARSRRTRADDLSETVKMVVLLGQYMQDHYHGRYYAKAQNLARNLKGAYDHALQECDLLVMPTLPLKATKIPAPDASREEYVARALEMIANTAPFDVTGHPAITVPCAVSKGLPVGMMLVGRTGEDATVLRAADAFQRQVYSPTFPA